MGKSLSLFFFLELINHDKMNEVYAETNEERHETGKSLEMMENKRDKAIEFFSRKMHCSQAVLATFSEECGITEEQAFKLGSCFGSGMRKGEVCGACTGALMVLGLLYGQSHIGDPDERQRSNMINDLMMERFKEKNGSYICNELLGYDISTPEGAQKAREEGLFTKFCPKMVERAVEILEEIINEFDSENV